MPQLMRIHIPSNETGWEMPKSGKKRSRKQGRQNPWRRTREDQEVITSNVLKAAFVFLDGQCSFWQDTIQDEPRPGGTKAGSCGNILQQSHICVTKPAREWFHEIFLQVIAPTGQLFRPWLFWARFCRFIFAFVFNFRPASTNCPVLPSTLFFLF